MVDPMTITAAANVLKNGAGVQGPSIARDKEVTYDENGQKRSEKSHLEFHGPKLHLGGNTHKKKKTKLPAHSANATSSATPSTRAISGK